MEEIWKDIKGYKGLYQVSNYGRVKSLKRFAKSNNNNFRPVKEKILKNIIDEHKYFKIQLNKDGKGKIFPVHRIVAETFIPNPNKLPCVNHKDENKQNNCVNNLEWCTYKYNDNYGTRNKRMSNKLKKKVYQYNLEDKFISEWNSATDIMNNLGFNKANIGACCNGKRKTAYGYKWSYKDMEW